MNKHLKTGYKGVTCKGSVALGTGCGVCERCLTENLGMESAGGVADTNHFPDYLKPNSYVRPPLGLRPRYIWLEARKEEIIEALQRQLKRGESLNEKWVDELTEVNEMMEEIQYD